MPSSPPTSGLVGLDLLDKEHVRTFKQALMNILMTDVAEFTYAQILDGLPTEQSLNDSYVYMEGHPVHKLEHKGLCEGYLDKTREFRSRFDPSSLFLNQPVGLPCVFTALRRDAKYVAFSYYRHFKVPHQTPRNLTYGSLNLSLSPAIRSQPIYLNSMMEPISISYMKTGLRASA